MTEEEMVQQILKLANNNSKEIYKNISKSHFDNLTISIRKGIMI